MGNATLRLALAITIITRLMHSTPSVHQRRSYSRSVGGLLAVQLLLEGGLLGDLGVLDGVLFDSHRMYLQRSMFIE